MGGGVEWGVVCQSPCLSLQRKKLSFAHLENQFPDQSVPLAVRLQAAIFVVGSNVDLVLEAQVVGQSV